ncbi:hypothetical protein JXD20_00210 [Candidatus Peregrinibacteria bacterium]|nr:hypothetical protein [Candidatus Peregrinibacteria bacterium]
MEFSTSSAETFPFILIAVAIPLIIFVLIPILVIRSIMKNIKDKIPFKDLKQLYTQLPKGVSMTTMKKYWNIEVDKNTGKLTIRRKTSDELEGKSQQTINPEMPPPSPIPPSASSKISAAKSIQPGTMQSPKTYETIQLIKKIAIVLVILFLIPLFKVLFSILADLW